MEALRRKQDIFCSLPFIVRWQRRGGHHSGGAQGLDEADGGAGRALGRQAGRRARRRGRALGGAKKQARTASTGKSGASYIST